MKNVTAVAVDGDDLLLDPEHLLPPPQIRGRLTRAAIENGLIVQQFGTAKASGTIAPTAPRVNNYMYYRGGLLRFGKLTMTDTDLLLVDADQKDHEQISQQVAEAAVGPPGLSARVDPLAVRQEALLRHFVRAHDDQLHDE